MRIGTLVIRADATVAMGSGHIMRCLALAQVWKDSGGQVVFASSELPPAIVRRVRDEGMEIENFGPTSLQEDAMALAALARQKRASTVIVDGYQFDSAYQKSLKASGLQVVWVDDTGRCGPYCADVVLNQNAYAHEGMYIDLEPGTKLLLGPRYVWLRKEFVPWQNWSREIAVVPRRLLVLMGGSDSDNFSSQVIRATQSADLGALEITVVIGGSNPHRGSLGALQSRSSGNIQLLVDVNDIAELMAEADLAISAAGHTCYELAFLQVPMILISLAENQVPAAAAMASAHAAIDAGWFAYFNREDFAPLIRGVVENHELRCSLASNAGRLVDGGGAHRTLQFLIDNSAARREGLSSQEVGVC